MSQIALQEPYTAPKPPTDQTVSFQLVLDDFTQGWLRVPPHQRQPDAWDDEKRTEYIRRLRESEHGRHPPGSIATYQIIGTDGRPGPIFLNDGLQRLTTLQKLRDAPSHYGMEDAEVRLLLQQMTSLQHRHYRTDDDAMQDFQLINNGTRLTAYELCNGYLRLMDGYETQWEPLLRQTYEVLQESETRLLRTKRAVQRSRQEVHKRRRHTLALFYRFLIEERRPIFYEDVPQSDVMKWVKKGQIIELRLRDALIDRGVEQVAKVVRQFRSFVLDETALLETLMTQREGGMNPGTHRWLLDLAVWRRTNRKTREEHSQFVRVLLAETGGQGAWPYKDHRGNPSTVTLRLSHLGLLPRLAEMAGMPGFCEKKRRQRRPSLMPGYDQSHLEPFSTNGEGPTFPEAAPLNRSRGANPVE